MTDIQVVIKVDHAPGDFHQWVFLPGYRGESIAEKRSNTGRRHRNAWRDWIVLICNNSECPAQALVRDSVLTDLAEAAHPVPKYEEPES